MNAARLARRCCLMALRELALRRTADRVEAAARAAVDQDRPSRARFARDRVLVALGPDPQAELRAEDGSAGDAT
jgi:two-component system, OmpR family, sensor histidine kinase KdpD